MAAWLRLDEALRSGKSQQKEAQERSSDELRNFILGMSDIGKMSAQEILEKVDLSACRHVLDVGGGPGSYSIAFLNAHPAMHATLFDHPEVLPIAREQVVKANLEDRFSFIGGDLASDDLGQGYDLILVSNIIHSFGMEANEQLVQKCYRALQAGGLLIIKDFLVEPDRSGPPFGLLFALHMFVNTTDGDTYSTTDVARWTDQAGFEKGRLIDVAANSRLWLARKPK
jgi:ubiquinone/menaquinone biosynthesis C-methylase UbiE